MALEKIARFLGHSSLESTQIYTHLVNGNEGQNMILAQPCLRGAVRQGYSNIPKFTSNKYLHEDE
jgi:hypothetical protein